MADWLTVARIDEIPLGQFLKIRTADYNLLIINLEGRYHVIENKCSHDGGELSGGEIEGEEIVCPRHGAHFCIYTGEATVPPAYESIQTYRVRIENHAIQVLIDR